jgi:hypothetical protein
MYDVAILAFTAIAAVAAVLTVLPLLGFDIRIRGRQTVPLAPTESRTRRAWLAFALALLSLGLSAGAFYYFFRPRVVEKIVEKTGEKPAPCPEQKEPAATPIPGAKPSKPRGPIVTNPITPPKASDSSQTPQTVINAQNGIGISGGEVTNPTVNNYAPPDRHLNQTAIDALSAIAESLPNKEKYPVGFVTVQGGEAETFADELAMVFYKKGVGAGSAPAGQYWNPKTPQGIIVCAKAKDAPSFRVAEQIANALTSNGVPAVGIMLNDKMDPDRVLVVIGEKTDGKPVGATTGYLIVR